MKNVLYFLLLFVIISCKSKENFLAEEVLNIDLQKINQDSLSNYFSKVEYIYLDSNALIGNVERMIVKNNAIYTICPVTSKTVTCFDISGKLKFQLNSTGQGPGEYVYPGSFWVSNEDSLYLIDTGLQKINIYDNRGIFKRSFRMSSFFAFMAEKNNQYLAFTDYANGAGKESYKLLLLNSNGEIESKYLPYSSDFGFDNILAQNSSCFQECGDNLFFCEPYSYNIYAWDGTELSNKYYLDFGKQTVSEDVFKKAECTADYVKEKKLGAWWIDHFYDFANYRFFDFSYNGFSDKYIEHKKTKKICLFKKLIGDIGVVSNISVFCGQDNALYALMEPSNIRDNLLKMKKTMNDEEWKLYIKKNQMSPLIKHINKKYAMPVVIKYTIK